MADSPAVDPLVTKGIQSAFLLHRPLVASRLICMLHLHGVKQVVDVVGIFRRFETMWGMERLINDGQLERSLSHPGVLLLTRMLTITARSTT
jgi:hypothetical protein